MSKAYTLIEILIVIGVLAILTGLASLSLVSFSKSGDLDTTRVIVIGALQEARANSVADIDDKTWGVHLEGDRVVVYANSGGGYNPSDPSNSARVLASHTLLSWDLAGGGANIEFDKRTGKTLNEGTVTISGSSPGVKTIDINSEGMIQ